jgi:excisionase family DNA binding protein
VNQAPAPELLTADETAAYLRTTRKAVYALAERGQLPGVVRVGRRLLVRRRALEALSDERGSGRRLSKVTHG